MKVTNNAKGLQGVRTDTGVVYLQPGQSKDVDLSETGLKQAKRLSFLSIEGKAKKDDGASTSPPPVALTAAEVLALVDGNFMAFKSAAKKVLGDALPDKKDEMVGALLEKMSDTEIKTFLATKNVETKDETRDQLVDLAKAA